RLVAGTLQTQELVDHSNAVIAQKNPTINAVIEVFEHGEVSQNVSPEHMLSGIPMIMKDNILIHGKKASGGSKMLENYTASYDSKIASLLKAQGAVIMGRANMDDSAMGS